MVNNRRMNKSSHNKIENNIEIIWYNKMIIGEKIEKRFWYDSKYKKVSRWQSREASCHWNMSQGCVLMAYIISCQSRCDLVTLHVF